MATKEWDIALLVKSLYIHPWPHAAVIETTIPDRVLRCICLAFDKQLSLNGDIKSIQRFMLDGILCMYILYCMYEGAKDLTVNHQSPQARHITMNIMTKEWYELSNLLFLSTGYIVWAPPR